MPTPPYAKALISLNGGPASGGGVVAAGSDVVQLSGESTVGWYQQRWEIYAYPDGFTAPVGWSTDASGVIFSTAVTPPSFTLPAVATRWGKWLVRLTVNGGMVNGKSSADLVDTTAAISTLSPKGQREIAALETTQFGGAFEGWVGEYNANLKTIESQLGGGGGGGGTPTGTGLRKVVGGVENAAASLLLNADVDAAAAIAGSKLQAASAGNAGSMSAAHFTKLSNLGSVAGNAATGTVNNFDPGTAQIIEFTGATGPTFTGMLAPDPGDPQVVFLIGPPGQTITFNEQDAASAAANRFENFPFSNNIVSTAIYAYAPTRQRWVLMHYTV
jgi:hypothetical protein